MCRLQFSSDAGLQHHHQHVQPSEPYADADDCVAALLALAAHNDAEFDLPEEPLPSSLKEVPYHPQAFAGQQQSASDSKDSKDSSRYHCPFPGCKRSFQELWRLKVHFRAPPNIRGSGKERGHGMRLTHCPKCGAALKVGGHHVKCAAVPKEPVSAGTSGSRRNRKAAAAARNAEPMDAAMAAAVYTEPSYQQSATAPTAGTAAAAAGASSRHGASYMQYNLPDGDSGDGQSLWHKALQLHAQQQQQQQQQQDCPDTPYKPDPAAAAASAAPLRRLASSDDGSGSRAVEASCSGGSGSGNDTAWAAPSSSSGYGSGSEDMDGLQQQQQQQQQPLLSLFGSQPPPAAAEVKEEQWPVDAAPAAAHVQQHEPQHQPQPQPQQPVQHPEAGQLLWQHMLLQHLQAHVQQAPGFSLPELIQVAATLFGNQVDTLVSAFGLSGGSDAAAPSREQAQLSQLVAGLRQAQTGADAEGGATAAAPPPAAVTSLAAYAHIFGAGAH